MEIQLDEKLFEQAREIASSNGMALEAVIEAFLKEIIEKKSLPKAPLETAPHPLFEERPLLEEEDNLSPLDIN